MEIKLFGKEGCGKCISTKNKIEYLLEKRKPTKIVQFSYFDIDTLNGLTEAAYNGVSKTPTTIVFKDGTEIARVEENIPRLSDLEELINR